MKEALGVNLKIEEHRRNSDKVPVDRVVWQSREPGATNLIKRGTTIRVELSAGPLVLRVPDLGGNDVTQVTSPRVTQVTRRLATAVMALTMACGGSALGTQPAATTATASASSDTAAATSTIAKVSANNATNAQLVSALTAAGVPNASSWAREVQEYRPYDANDTNLTKLRQNLVKYNPAPGVVDNIVSALSLP